MNITKEEFIKLVDDNIVIFDEESTENIITTRLLKLVTDITKREIEYIYFNSQFDDWFKENNLSMIKAIDFPEYKSMIDKRYICIFKLTHDEASDYYNDMILGNY